MADRSLHWVVCDTAGCTTSTRDDASEDPTVASDAASRLGWSHYTIDPCGGPFDVCPLCLVNRPDLAALCLVEQYDGP